MNDSPGVLAGKTVIGKQMVFGSWEDMHIDIWGPGQVSTSGAIPAILSAPGAALVTSNRRDILVGPGNAGKKTTLGPALKYASVNMSDLKFSGRSVPSSVVEGDKFRFTAEVGEYRPNQGCLFFLTPVSTTVR